jgi:phage-related protein
MIVEQDDPTLVEIGAWGAVRYATRANGQMEAHDWLRDASERARAKFSTLFRKIAAVGKISNEEQFRHLRDGIWEFKRGGDRIFCFQDGLCWWLTHHYAKSGRRCPNREIERAIQIRAEDIERRRT